MPTAARKARAIEPSDSYLTTSRPRPVASVEAVPSVRPFIHRLYVRSYKAPEERTTTGGLIVTQRATEREMSTDQYAKILSVGKGCDPDLIPGGWVQIPRFTGSIVLSTDSANPDIGYLIIHADSVIAMCDRDYIESLLGPDALRD